MKRWVLKDEQWERVAPLLPGKIGDPGRSGSDNRLFLEAVLWMVRTGAPWRDLPEAFGSWNSVLIVHTQSTKRLALPLGASW